MTETRRLDERLFTTEPYEMVLPSPRMAFVGRLYRQILTVIQCGVVLLTLSVVLLRTGVRSSTVVGLVLLTTAYIGGYLLRLSTVGDRLNPDLKRRLQLVSGCLEISLLGVLGLIYTRTAIVTTTYWWALFILPVFRLAERAGGPTAWLFGLLLSSCFLSVNSWVATAQANGPLNWIASAIPQISLLVLATFIQYYILRLLEMRGAAVGFWRPLASQFIGGPADINEARQLVATVFTEGVEKLIGADFGALWIHQPDEDAAVYRLVYRYERRRPPRFVWQRWLLLRDFDVPGSMYEGKLTLVPSNPAIQCVGTVFAPETMAAYHRSGGRDSITQWLVARESHAGSACVAPIRMSESRYPVGYLEVGLGWKLHRSSEKEGFKERVYSVAAALGQVYAGEQQLKANMLRKKLFACERDAADEAELFSQAAQAMHDYFQRPVLIADFSEESNRIQSYTGVPVSDNVVRWVEESLRGHGLGQPLQLDPITACRTVEGLMPDQPDEPCFYAYGLAARRTRTQQLLLIDRGDSLTGVERLALHESARTLSAAVARRRAAGLLRPDASMSFASLTTRRRLRQLAEDVKAHTDADVVVLYELEDGLPVEDPIIVGHLEFPDYWQDKPNVIKDDNPILQAERAAEPLFFERIQSHSFGRGRNPHGDPVFARREGIASSIAVPLKAWHRSFGAMWVNFREGQTFDESTKAYFQRLVRHLPDILEHQTVIESVRADLHDQILGSVHAAEYYIDLARKSLSVSQHERLTESLFEATVTLGKAKSAISVLLGTSREPEIPVLAAPPDIACDLQQLAAQLLTEHGFPERLVCDGLEAIPLALCEGIYPVIAEAVKNACKHGKATCVSVKANRENGVLEVIVSDNGSGFRPHPDRYRQGIRSMRIRVLSLRGQLQFSTNEGGGTEVIITIPHAVQEAEESTSHE